MRENEQELLRGSVAAVVYQNAENGYTVLRLNCEDDTLITVVGTIPMAVVGEQLMITGHWINHISYGRQFEAEYLERLMPEETKQILAYLSSGAVKGIGEKLAERIVEKFGSGSLEVLENHPERLARISGISEKKALELNSSFIRQVGVRRLIEYFSLHRLPAELAMRLYRVYGELSMEALEDNPYLLAEEYFGADFALVDAFALEIGIMGDDERRVEAGALFELVHNLNNGHTFLPKDALIQATASLLDLSSECAAAAVERLAAQQRVIKDEIARLEAAYLPSYYDAECYLTQRLLQMAKKRRDTPAELQRLIHNIEQQQKITYAERQRQAISEAAGHGLMLLTGGPGTGKTTTLAGVLSLFDNLKLKTLLAAPTGRAAKRLSELTGREATTIHRLLEVDISAETGMMCFVHDESEHLQCDAVIVDEASMVDLLLMDSLVRALPENCRLILVGDPDQLPSVGAGNLFSDLIRSERICTVRLTEIFRQAQKSLIVMNAHAINCGGLPELGAKDRDFFFLRRTDSESVVQTIIELCSKRLPHNMGIDSRDIQVLSPTRKGKTGTWRLNRELQAVLNPPSESKKEKSFGDFTFREGDKVMQIKNNYDILWSEVDGHHCGTGIFNGDIGVITAIDLRQETMVIRYDDREAAYTFNMLTELEPAYAMTVHKSQGSEYPAVVFCAFQGSPYLLTRSVLYTAVTRARRLLIGVGTEQTVAAMVANDKRQKRFSGLKWRLQRQSL